MKRLVELDHIRGATTRGTLCSIRPVWGKIQFTDENELLDPYGPYKNRAYYWDSERKSWCSELRENMFIKCERCKFLLEMASISEAL